MIENSVIESNSGSYYLIKDKICIDNNTNYLCIDIISSKIEIIKPIHIKSFIDLSMYLYIDNKLILNTDANIINELSNKINFKTSFNIKKGASEYDILETEILLEDNIKKILIDTFKIYPHDEISTIKKIVMMIKQRNSASCLIKIYNDER